MIAAEHGNTKNHKKMNTELMPTSGLIIVTSYNPHTRNGFYEIFDLESKEHIIPREEFKNVLTSDNTIGILGICRACQICIDHNYSGKIYCSNQTAFGWAKSKKVKTKISERSIRELVKQKMDVLFTQDFSGVISFWKLEWGSLREHRDFLLMPPF